MDAKCPFCGASDKFGGHEVPLAPETAAYIIHCTACGHIIGMTQSLPSNRPTAPDQHPAG